MVACRSGWHTDVGDVITAHVGAAVAIEDAAFGLFGDGFPGARSAIWAANPLTDGVGTEQYSCQRRGLRR